MMYCLLFLVLSFPSLYESGDDRIKNYTRIEISGGDNFNSNESTTNDYFHSNDTIFDKNVGRNRSTIKASKRPAFVNLTAMDQNFSASESKKRNSFYRQHNSNKSRDNMKQKLRLLQNVCVFHHNWRTASLFELNVLSLRGNGSLKYIVNDNTQLKKNCKSGLINTGYNIELVCLQGSVINYNYPYTEATKEALSSRPGKRIVTGDEDCDCKFSDCGIFPNMKGVVGRQYFSEKLMPQWEFGGSVKGRSNTIAFIPLGPRSDFGLIPWTQEPPEYDSTNKTWVFNLIISPTSESRKRLAKMLNTTSFKKGIKGPVPFIVNVAKHWHGKFGAAAPDSINSTQYKQILQNSVFTLCPNGRNPESFRIYEAVEAGSIPILALDKEYESHSCKNAFLPFVKYNAPFVFLKDWKQLPKTLSMYLENPEKVAHLQRRLKPWYMQFFANISKQLDNAAGYGKRLPKPSGL